MPVYDELEYQRQKRVIFWLTVLWLSGMGWIVTSYYTVDLTGTRKPANWDDIRNIALIGTLNLDLEPQAVSVPGARGICCLSPHGQLPDPQSPRMNGNPFRPV